MERYCLTLHIEGWQKIEMIKKIKFYKGLLLEFIETLCTICLYLEREGHFSHNNYSQQMNGHFRILKQYSTIIRSGKEKEGFKNEFF